MTGPHRGPFGLPGHLPGLGKALPTPPDVDSPFEFLVTHRTNGFTSGVARFNQICAELLRIPVATLFGNDLPRSGDPLLSFKVSEFTDEERAALDRILDEVTWRYSTFLHDYAGTDLERRLVAGAQVVYCGNPDIERRVRRLNAQTETLWSPGLILDARRFEPTAISVFSFGMAHKLHTAMFERLRDLLDASGHSYAVYVSGANHESASMGDAQVVYQEMNRIFPRGLYFLGNLSDMAVYNYLQTATFFSAFFPGGVRANNGSVAAAMDHGSVVITNLDDMSPSEFVHMENVIDIMQCDQLPIDPLVLKRISVRAEETAHARGWNQLVERLCRRPVVAG